MAQLHLEQSWLMLAESYEVAERTSVFIEAVERTTTEPRANRWVQLHRRVAARHVVVDAEQKQQVRGDREVQHDGDKPERERRPSQAAARWRQPTSRAERFPP